MAIKHGTLAAAATNNDAQVVEFDSPLDHLLMNLLRYQVVAHYKRKRKQMKLQPAPETVLAQLPDSETSGSETMRKRRRGDRFTEEEVGAKKVHVMAFGKAVACPSDDDWTAYDQLLTHGPMMQLIEDTIDATPEGCKPWQPNDKVGDRVAKDFRPLILPAGPTLPASLASNKRQRVSGPEFAVSMPLLASQRPPKTPERK